MIPSERLQKLKSLQELGAAIRRQERELNKDNPPLRSAASRLVYLRRLELQAWTMTASERAEYARLEREYQADHDDERQNDWTR